MRNEFVNPATSRQGRDIASSSSIRLFVCMMYVYVCMYYTCIHTHTSYRHIYNICYNFAVFVITITQKILERLALSSNFLWALIILLVSMNLHFGSVALLQVSPAL